VNKQRISRKEGGRNEGRRKAGRQAGRQEGIMEGTRNEERGTWNGKQGTGNGEWEIDNGKMILFFTSTLNKIIWNKFFQWLLSISTF